jgi:hypothetical protein
VFEYLVAEHLIDTSRRVYCPYKDCSLLLERPEPEEEMVDASGNQEAPYECPACHRHFCLSCGVTGWHAVSVEGGVVDWGWGWVGGLGVSPATRWVRMGR